MIDATPALPEQLDRLMAVADQDSKERFIPDGVLLTHLHMGHWPGLLHFGREALNSKNTKLWATWEAHRTLQGSEITRHLINDHHFQAIDIEFGFPERLTPNLSIEPIKVPHRSELDHPTAAFIVRGPSKSLLWCPDIDSWEGFEAKICDLVREVDVAFLDGCFWSPEAELGSRGGDVPHPPMPATLELLGRYGLNQRVKFIHMNHTNPGLVEGSAERVELEAAGAAVADDGEIIIL
jgi:pyrroloquinoline quinone biosynthesis protein B